MKSPILINDLRRHAEDLRQELRRACDRVLDSGWYILGEECRQFELEFASFCGVAECVGVANGTDAIELALRAIGLKDGCRVATVANAGFYSSIAIRNIGAEPAFVDIDESTQLMDLDGLREVVGARAVDAVVVTHLFGRLHDMDAVLEITGAADIPVLEDCAQAHGATQNGRRSGSFGAAASFSFYPTKNLGAIGDGGAVTTNDPAVAGALRQLRQYGWDTKYRVSAPGGRNSRLDEIQAATLRVKLKWLDGWNARRREVAKRYSEGISNPDVTCPFGHGADFVAHLYVVATDDREGLRRHLAEAQVATDVHYPIPDHCQPMMQRGQNWPSLPRTEAAAKRVVTFPCFPELRDEEVEFIIERVNLWKR